MGEAEALSPAVFSNRRSDRAPTVAPADDRRFAEMVTANLDFIWRCLRRMGIPSAEVDDAVQQVFLVAASKLSIILPGSERAFLFSTASRIAANARRAVHRRDEAHHRLTESDPPPNPTPEDLADRLEARRMMDHVLAEMPADLHEVFVLFELEELSIAELANLLSIPMGTVGSRLRRAREDFHARVQRLQAAERRRGPR